MLKTAGERFKKVRIYLGLEQKDYALLLHVTPSAISQKESGAIPVSSKEAVILQDKHDINISWLLGGSGEMLNHPNLVKESAAIYKSSDKWNLVSVRERFIAAVDDFILKHNGIKQREVAKRWKVNEQQLSNIINRGKDVSIAMLSAALRYGNVNLNYLLGEVGDMHIDSKTQEENKLLRAKIAALQASLKDKERIIALYESRYIIPEEKKRA